MYRYCVFASITIKQQYVVEARYALTTLVSFTQREEGCHVFNLLISPDNKQTIYLYEEFTDEQAYNYHISREYTQDVFKKYETWLAEPIQKIVMQKLIEDINVPVEGFTR